VSDFSVFNSTQADAFAESGMQGFTTVLPSDSRLTGEIAAAGYISALWSVQVRIYGVQFVDNLGGVTTSNRVRILAHYVPYPGIVYSGDFSSDYLGAEALPIEFYLPAYEPYAGSNQFGNSYWLAGGFGWRIKLSYKNEYTISGDWLKAWVGRRPYNSGWPFEWHVRNGISCTNEAGTRRFGPPHPYDLSYATDSQLAFQVSNPSVLGSYVHDSFVTDNITPYQKGIHVASVMLNLRSFGVLAQFPIEQRYNQDTINPGRWTLTLDTRVSYPISDIELRFLRRQRMIVAFTVSFYYGGALASFNYPKRWNTPDINSSVTFSEDLLAAVYASDYWTSLGTTTPYALPTGWVNPLDISATGNAKATYNWNVGSGAVFHVGDTSYPSPVFTYTTVGIKTISVDITDSAEDTYSSGDNLRKVAAILIANFISSDAASPPRTKNFFVYYTWLIPSSVTYLWTFGDSSTSTLAAPTHTYASDGTYSVSLTVTAPNGWWSKAVSNIII
jgi:hypothetical protein